MAAQDVFPGTRPNFLHFLCFFYKMNANQKIAILLQFVNSTQKIAIFNVQGRSEVYLSPFCGQKLQDMDDYKKLSTRKAKCLECGTRLGPDARPDKKFCSKGCRYAYHNAKKYKSKQLRLKVDTILERNYHLLDQCITEHRQSISLAEFLGMGFNPAYITSSIQLGSFSECTCYDIAYRISDTKVFNIHRMFVTLRNGKL